MKNGDLIIIPTDTVYGLAARLYDDEALEKIYQLKGRDKSKPIPILCSKMSDLLTIAETTDLGRSPARSAALFLVSPGKLLRKRISLFHCVLISMIFPGIPRHIRLFTFLIILTVDWR